MVQQSLFPNLAADHHKMGDLVMKIKVERRPAALDRLSRELSAVFRKHFEIEESAMYPVLLEAVTDWEDRIVLRGAHEDHRLIMHLLDELDETAPDEERFKGKVHALDKLWSHHVEEEEGSLYEMARNYLDQEQFRTLVQRIEHAEREAAAQNGLTHGPNGTR